MVQIFFLYNFKTKSFQFAQHFSLFMFPFPSNKSIYLCLFLTGHIFNNKHCNSTIFSSLSLPQLPAALKHIFPLRPGGGSRLLVPARPSCLFLWFAQRGPLPSRRLRYSLSHEADTLVLPRFICCGTADYFHSLCLRCTSNSIRTY